MTATISDDTRGWIESTFTSSIVPTLTEYIKIPNKSPSFDPDWQAAGHMDRAVALFVEWATANLPQGAKLQVVQLPERTPVIAIDIPATGGASGDTILLYGHLDKQPEMVGWRDDLGPWKPVLEGDKLYGRGGADDGYALFASLTAINALRRDKLAHARCVVLIEASEESGSPDLPAYIEHLRDLIGTPSLVVCLDSGCGNYDQLWSTTSLRGNIVGVLEVELLKEGVHSGGSGIVASTFRVMRKLLDRLEDVDTGMLKPPELTVAIPRARITQAAQAAEVLGNSIWKSAPLVEGAQPMHTDPAELILNKTWRATLSVTGADGLPTLVAGGNVLRPRTALKLSLRLPPTLDAAKAEALVKSLLERDPPYGAKVTFHSRGADGGWNAPEVAPWLEGALSRASVRHFGKPSMYIGEGGSIPFMGMLGEKFPAAQFVITGVLGPNSNAHGPNEFLHVPTARRLTMCVADVIAAHASR
ncbi:MAG: M20 family metallopeptidase [Myxococcales bacterium]|nr:M20 family metallopeptidase [Myxococcales bacterium]